MKKEKISLIVIILCLVLPIQVFAYSITPNQFNNIENEEYLLINSVSENSSNSGYVSGGDSIEDSESETERDILNKEKYYENYCNQLNANLFDQYTKYLIELEKDKREKHQIAEAEYSLGYITELELKEIEISEKAVLLELESAKDQRDYYIECLGLRGEAYKAEMLNTNLKEMTKDYQKDFLHNNSELIEIENRIAIYQKYLQNSTLNEQELDNINIQLNELLKYKQYYEIELKEYVLELQLNYRLCYREIESIDNEIEMMKLKIKNQKALLEDGKVIKNSLTELEVLLHELEYERSKSVYEGLKIMFILENQIEGQTI